MCFRSAGEGQKAFRGRAASSNSLYSWQENLNSRGTKAREGPELRRKSLRAVLDQDLKLNGRSEKFRHSLPR